MVESGDLVRPPEENDPAWVAGYDRDNLMIVRPLTVEEAVAMGVHIPEGPGTPPPANYLPTNSNSAVVIGKKRSNHKLMAVRSEEGTVTVFRDRNRNGVLDRKDLRLSGASVFIDVDKSGTVGGVELSFHADSAGRVRFGSVPIRADILKVV